jgi:trigger factor
MTADRIEFMLRKLPLAQSVAVSSIKLPEVKAPSLEGLLVDMPTPPDLTVDDVLRAAENELSALGAERERQAGEALERGDTVCVDVLGYSNGRLIPFSARFDFWMRLQEEPELPGMLEVIANAHVGETVVMRFAFPNDYSQVALRGQPAIYIVTVKAARSLKRPNPKTATFLKKAGAKSYEDWLKQVTRRLEETQSSALALEVQNRVLDAVLARVVVEVPAELVDEEIRRKWANHEGRAMAERSFGAAEQQEAFEGWLRNAGLRAETQHRLATALVLRAIVDRDGLTLDPKRGKDLLLTFAAQAGMDKKTLKAELAKSKMLAEEVAQLGLHLVAVDHVMSKAKVKFQ